MGVGRCCWVLVDKAKCAAVAGALVILSFSVLRALFRFYVRKKTPIFEGKNAIFERAALGVDGC